MADDSSNHTAPTRRGYIKHGGAVVGGGLLAGCASDSGSENTTTGTTTGEEATPKGSSYSATLAPADKVTLESEPEDIFTMLGHHADMVLALGRGDDMNAMFAPEYHQGLYRKLTHHFDGVSIDWEGLYNSWPPKKEKLYELDSNVHIADPAKVATADGWDNSDVQEIEENVAPWFGNTLSGTNRTPPAGWKDQYEYYTLWEIFGKVAQLLGADERYRALASVRDSMVQTIEENRPPESERPTAALVLFSSSEDHKGWGYKMNHPGYYAAHTRPMGVTDALSEAFGEGYGESGRNMPFDYELLLEADPDVLLVLGSMTAYFNPDEIRKTLENHEVASDLTAVKEGNVYAQGARRQGPILNLFQLEMTAKQLYPNQFGEWPGYQNGKPYPQIPEEEQLFDRQRVANIINGDL
ncbi:ABC transporter substrate-binding protein [Halopiger aswanensis]|uniref:ABC-type Fe3+-hydroxamate transport system substrate-binding protein n=1 Tax=Halopiger aswanensis TaxID=148449 RepID=A0A3R7ED65_9EURY|nr:ABC transporter substrate-binding protein [Halopiger aswanensis]RKD93379.1 ABC-type Fe3+-hydroxamate transport system substrate-binding protein [Halopiger aswanensis]